MMKHIQLYALFLMLVFHTSSGQSQTEVKKNIIKSETKDSITSQVPNSGVFDIKQDRKGNIWMATNNGVYRYDGKSFTNITSKVSSARFISVLEDRKGNFWFASLGSGVYYYDGKSFRNFTTREGLPSNQVGCMYEDKAGLIWFGTTYGASRYDGKSFLNLKMKEDALRVHNDIHTITEDKTGKLWFGTRGETFVYDGKTFTTLTNKDGHAFNNVWCIIEDRKGNIWFAADGLWRYNGSTFTKINQTGAGVIVEDKKRKHLG